MATLQTQYNNFLKNNPHTNLTYKDWLDKLSKHIAEVVQDHSYLSEWDVTLMDGLKNEPPYVSDDFQIGPHGAYEHIEKTSTPKVTFTFDYHEDKKEIQEILDGPKWKFVLWELDQKLRSVTKYGASLNGLNTQATETEIDTCENIRNLIRELMSADNLNFD